jgi:anti-sigma factor RsiW
MGVPVRCEHSEQFSMLMSMHLDDLLDVESQDHMQRHLAACPSCQAEWVAMQQVSAVLERSDMAGPPLGFAVRVERRLEEKVRKRQRNLQGLALLTGSLSLAGIALAATAALVLVLVFWLWPSSQSALQQGGSPVSQVTFWIGSMGQEMTVFLKDLFLQYGIPLLLLAGTGLAVLSAISAWLFTRRPRGGVANGQ